MFAAMVIMLVGNFIFALLEAGRYTELNKISKMRADAEIESVFSQFCWPLYEEYGLLGYDCQGKSIEAYIANMSDRNFEVATNIWGMQELNLLRLDLASADTYSYTLLTDGEGAIFEANVASYMRENVAYGAAEIIYDAYLNAQSTSEEAGDVGENVDSAIAELEKLEADDDDGKTSEAGGVDRGSYVEDETLTTVSDTKASGVLALVMGEDGKISGKAIDTSNVLSNRTVNVGVNTEAIDNSWLDYVCLEQYIMQNMGSYANPKEGRALDYEIEYIVAGKARDEENLKAVVNELLLMREATNFVYLQTDSKKQNEALTLATAIAGASVNPAVVEVVKQGLLAGWAYCESVLDVRALLEGDRIPAIKTTSTWTSNISEISELLSGNAKAKSDTKGINYQDILGTLLMLKGVKSMAYRCMDIQEMTVRMVEGYEDFRMDNVISCMKISFNYEYVPVFFGIENREITQNVRYAYYKM